MKKRLNYIFPAENAKVVSLSVDPSIPYFESWLYSMMAAIPGVIWFYTVDTTDIWDDFDYGNYDFSKVKVLDRYRGYTITTRLSGGSGCRIYRPYGEGILNFAFGVKEARGLIDKQEENK